MVWCWWQAAAHCQVDGMQWGTQQGGVALIVCVFFDKGSSRVMWRQEAWAQCQQRGCVSVYMCVDGRGNVAVAGCGPFHISQTQATLAKGIMQSPPLCVWEGTRARGCERVFFFRLYPCVRADGSIGRGFHTWLTATKPSLRRQIQFKAARLFVFVSQCCASYIFFWLFKYKSLCGKQQMSFL